MLDIQRASSEKALQDRALKWFRECDGCDVIRFVAGPYAEPGVADLLINWFGKFVAIELKEPGRVGGICFPEDFHPKDLRERRQVKFLYNVNKNGGVGFFADNLEAIIAELTKLIPAPLVV